MYFQMCGMSPAVNSLFRLRAVEMGFKKTLLFYKKNFKTSNVQILDF